MGKRILWLVFLILILPSISAIKITEVEMNPEGADSGNEWVELYSETEINLSSYKLINNDRGEILLNGSFSGYYVYIFDKQWLDNVDEKVFLYKNNELVDETDLFEDKKDDDLTWQLCEKWEFIESTKGEKNNCKVEDNEEPLPINDFDEDDENGETNESAIETTSIPDYEEISNENKREPITAEIIKLNPKVIKSENDSENNKDLSDYAIYTFVVFCILFGFLFALKKYKAKKNETEW